MPDDWRRHWRSWLHRDHFAHRDSPAGGSGTGFSRTPTPIEYSWTSMPALDSPAGRFLHWPTELWRLEQQERDEIARHVEELENVLARRSDHFRASIPDSYLRTLYDRQVGRIKGAYGFTKSLASTGVDAALLLQKLTSPIGWSDPDLQNKIRHECQLGLAIGRAFYTWEFGTLGEKRELLTRVASIAHRIYEDAQRNIDRQWAEAKRNGKQEELIEEWKTRLVLEIGTLWVGAGELRAAHTEERILESNRVGEIVRSKLESDTSILFASDIKARPLSEVDKTASIDQRLSSQQPSLLSAGDLDAYEGVGYPPGHLLKEHVGITYEDLASRLAREPKLEYASSFTDSAAADQAVRQTVDSNKAKIIDWLHNSSTKRLVISDTMSEPVGTSVPRGAPVGIPAKAVKLVLIRDSAFPDGYRILTGYPEL